MFLLLNLHLGSFLKFIVVSIKITDKLLLVYSIFKVIEKNKTKKQNVNISNG